MRLWQVVVTAALAGFVWVGLHPTLPAIAAPTPSVHYFVDCSSKTAGDGSSTHPWNRIAQVNAHDPL